MELLIVFFKGALASLAIFLFFWAVSLIIKNPSIIDVCWGMGFIAITYVYITHGAGWTTRNAFMFAAVSFWGLRLSYFVLKRLGFGTKEDHRYVTIREKWKPYVRFNFLVFFVVQAIIECFVSLPFLYIAVNPAGSLSFVDGLAIILCLAAIIGESVADEQLERFKHNPSNKGKVCQAGLWNYSRHPNYFFEFMIWFSFYIFALGSPHGWLSFVSPLIMLHLIINVSGIKFAERLSVERRGAAYRKYQQTTSMFIPLPKRAI